MQTLLEERFDLKIRREKREVPVYLLNIGNNGVKLRKTPEGTCMPFDFSEALNMTPADQPFCGVPNIIQRGPVTTVDVHGITLGAFSRLLHPDGRPVIDQTGLTGMFEIHLEWGSDVPDQSATATGVASDPPSSASARAALREQLGLELKSARGVSEFLIVDHIGKAREN